MISERISVILPCLNEAAILRQTLESLQWLRRDGHELILVDGGSLDNSLDLARPLTDRVLKTQPGRARQMNAGAAIAGGDILWFVHLDTQVPPGAEQYVLRFAGPQGVGWGRFDVRLSGRRRSLRVIQFLMNLRSRVSGIATGDQGIFVRRELFERVGGFPDLALMEDVALSRTLKRHAAPARLRMQLVTSSRRWEQYGIVRTVLLMWRLRLAFALGADPNKLAHAYRQCTTSEAGS